MSSDLIDRDYILSALGVFNDTANGDWDYLAGIETAKEIVRNAPTIEAEPVRHGHWEIVDFADPLRYGCSKCKVLSWDLSNFCPNCGAKMDEVTP